MRSIQTKTPTVYNYSLGIQQDIGYGTIVEISYVGSWPGISGKGATSMPFPTAQIRGSASGEQEPVQYHIALGNGLWAMISCAHSRATAIST